MRCKDGDPWAPIFPFILPLQWGLASSIRQSRSHADRDYGVTDKQLKCGRNSARNGGDVRSITDSEFIRPSRVAALNSITPDWG